MAEYTWENLIFNPTTDEAKNAVGKEVYFSNAPLSCIGYANENNKVFIGVLDSTSESNNPFYIRGNGYWACIIVKKEELKPQYVPFSNWEDFMDAYISCLERNKEDTGREAFLANHGIWLYSKYDSSAVNVIHISNEGLITVISDIKLNTECEYGEFKTTEWEDVLTQYEFLDGSTCGKEAKE